MKFIFCINKENIAHSSCKLYKRGKAFCIKGKVEGIVGIILDQIKKIFWMFIFENFIKEAKLSVSRTKLKRL